MQQYNIGALFEQIPVDVVGPLSETHARNWYLLVVINYFMELLEVYTMTNQEAVIAN